MRFFPHFVQVELDEMAAVLYRNIRCWNRWIEALAFNPGQTGFCIRENMCVILLLFWG